MTLCARAQKTGKLSLPRALVVGAFALGALVCSVACLGRTSALRGWDRGDHAPSVKQESEKTATAQDPAGDHTNVASSATGDMAASVSKTADLAAASVQTLHAADATSGSLADLIYRIVEATEDHNLRLRKFDADIEFIDREIDHIRTSEGWEFEISDQSRSWTADRLETRGGTTQRLDGTFRKAHRFFGEVSDKYDEFVLRLQRSFGEPDHERFVDAALKRLEKLEKVAAKQEVRRDLHLATIDSVLIALYCQAARPLIEERLVLAKERLRILEAARQAQEALRKDVLSAQRDLHLVEDDLELNKLDCRAALRELNLKTGTTVSLPAALPLIADGDPPPETYDEEAVTSYALEGRLDYFVADLRLKLADKLKWHLAWHLPKIDFEVWWADFSAHRRYLDEYRKDRNGDEYGTELSVNIPLNIASNSWARHKMFSAARDAIALDHELIRRRITEEVFRTYRDWRKAYHAREISREQIEVARENERALALMVERMPDKIEGIPKVELIDEQVKIVDAKMSLLQAEHDLLRAKVRWDYLLGDSPIDVAAAPFVARDRQTAEKTSWLKWWMSLIK